MKGLRVRVWHPESSGSMMVVYRPWWRIKRRPFATLRELRIYHRDRGPVFDVRDLLRNYEGMG